MNLSHDTVFQGSLFDLHELNLVSGTNYTEQQWAFIRYNDDKRMLVVANFSTETVNLKIKLPTEFQAIESITTYLTEVDVQIDSDSIAFDLSGMNAIVIEL